MSDELTPSQLLFVQEYLVDLNGKQAAIRAGYSERTAHVQASRLLTLVKVQKAISHAQLARSDRTKVTADRVLTELAKIGFADIRRAVEWGAGVLVTDAETGDQRIAHGVTLVASAALDDDTAAAISEVSQSRDGTLKIKMHDKKGALVDMGRHLGMFLDRQELTGKDGAPLVPVLNVTIGRTEP